MKKGYITLISVIIIGAIILSITTFMVFININALHNILIMEKSFQARGLAKTCSEQALWNIANNPDYSGNETLHLDKGNCTYTIINSGEDKIIESSGQIKNIIRKEKIIINEIDTKIHISSWQEIPNF